MRELTSIFILVLFPVLYKMVKDWNGIKHPAIKETEMLIFIMVINSTLMALFWCAQYDKSDILEVYAILIAKCFIVSACGFQLIFPYLINWRLTYKFGYTGSRFVYIMNHLSEVAIPDKWVKGIHWSIRLIVYVSLFTASVIWFVS